MISVIVEHVKFGVIVENIHQRDFKGIMYRAYFLGGGGDLNFANFMNPATICEN